MACNPTPEVGAARDFGKQFGADRVVILYCKPDGQYNYASYGKDRRLCAQARRVADRLYDEIGQAFAEESD